MNAQSNAPQPANAAPAIIIDDREQAGGLAAELLRRLGSRAAIRRLAVGDILIGGILLIERKSVADLIASLLDGRFDSQMQRLKSAAAPPLQSAVIVEGDLANAAATGLSTHELRRALMRIQFDWDHKLIRSRDLQDTAAWIELLASHAHESGNAPNLPFSVASEKSKAGPNRSTRRAPLRGADALQLAALKQIPGLGPRKARALLDEFGSLSNLRAAEPNRIAALPGISPELADQIIRHLRRG